LYPTLAVLQDDSRGGRPTVLAGGLQGNANRRLRLAPIPRRNRRRDCATSALLSVHQEVGIAPDGVAVSGGCRRNATPIVALRRRWCHESAARGDVAGDNDPPACLLLSC
jgi:hypothetical protein